MSGLNPYQGFETAPLRKIAFADYGTPVIDLPDAGQLIEWSGLPAWTPIGNIREDADVGSLAAESVSFEWREENVDLDPPLAQGLTGLVPIKNALQSVSFAAFSVNNDILEVGSLWSDEAGVLHPSTTPSHRAMILEYYGTFIAYCPRVVVRAAPQGGGVTELAVVSFNCHVITTDSYPGGVSYHFYEETGS